MNEIRYIEITEESSKRALKNNPWKTALIYFIVGSTWIFFSDMLLGLFIKDIDVINNLQTIKGAFYIIATSVGLYFLMKLENKKLIALNKQLIENQEELMMFSEELISGDDELRVKMKELRKVTEALEKEQVLNDEIFDHSNSNIVIWTTDGQLIKMNQQFRKTIGLEDENDEEINIFDLISISDKSTFEAVKASICKHGEYYELETKLKKLDGKEIPVIWNVSRLNTDFNNQKVFISYGLDISDVYEKTKELEHFKEHDLLTGLWQKDVFYKDMLLWKQDYSSMNFYLIGIDDFSALNNLYGHLYGDHYLKHIGKEIMHLPSTKAYRWDGDEILIACPLEVTEVVSWVNEIFEVERKLDNIDYKAYVSMGVLEQSETMEAEVIVQYLHIALNKAKENGKKQTIRFEKSYLDEILEKRNLEDCINDMLDHDLFELFLQPIFDMADKKTVSFEVLLRCHHPDVSMNIGDVILFAEKNGKIVDIDRWVIHHVFMMLEVHENFFIENNYTISINISAQSFYLDGFIDFLSELIEKYQVNTSRINIEVTEYSVIKDLDKAKSRLDNLKSLGFKLSLDDFGTDYSSLNYVSKLPFDTLKIDKSYVDLIHKGQQDYIIVKHLINLTHDLNIHTIAEGIELEEQYQVLKEIGCDLGQGYLISPPKPAETFLCDIFTL